MSLPTGLSPRNGVWQLRIGVPADLAHLYPSIDAFRGSLKTRDRAEAITKAHALIAQYRETFDQQRAAEAIKRAPPFVPLTPELERFLIAEAGWLALLADDLVRFTPGAAEAIAPATRYLTAGAPGPLAIGDGVERWNRLQHHALEAARTALALGHLDRVQEAADAALHGLKLRVDWSEPHARVALARIARAQVRAAQENVGRAKGEPHDTPAKPEPPVVAVTSSASQPSPLYIRDLKVDWLALKARTEAATKMTDRALRELASAGVDVPLAALTRTHGATYRAHLLAQGMRGQSVKNLIVPIQALLNMAVESGKLAVNPWAGLKVDTSDSVKRRPWRMEDLSKLVAANNGHAGPERWLLPLGLYSGARIGELAQMELKDIMPVDGIQCFEIHNRADEGHANRTVKTEAGLRFVPISQHLIDLGLLDHVEAAGKAGERFLFPAFIQNGKRLPTELAGMFFKKLREGSGVPIDERFTFHSLRHNVRSALAAANVNDRIIDKLIGHESSDVQGRYTHATPRALADAVAKLDWSALGMR